MNMSQNANTRDTAMALLRKAWKDMPDARAMLLSSLYSDEIWNLPELYDYAREAVIPTPGRPVASPWAGLDSITMWGNNGTVTNTVTQLLAASTRQKKIDDLGAEVEEAVKRSPDWAGGKALLAILKGRRGLIDEARAGLEPLTKRDPSIPMYARMVVAQEIEPVESLRDVAMKVLEATVADYPDQLAGNSNGFEYGPGKRLALLYQKAGRSKDARELILKATRTPADYSMYDANYAGYQKVQETVAVASLLQDLGYPADAARFYSDIANDLAGPRRRPPDVRRRPGPVHGPDRLGPGTVAPGDGRRDAGQDRADHPHAEARRQAGASPGSTSPCSAPCPPRDRRGVVCLFAESIRGLKGSKDLLAEIRESLDRLVAAHPDDLSILAASAMVAGLDGNAEAIATPVERLSKLVDAQALEPLPPNGRANARQREEATRQLVLWGRRPRGVEVRRHPVGRREARGAGAGGGPSPDR